MARRALLTIAQWGSNDTINKPKTISHVLRWKSKTVSLPDLSSRLKKEKFGGRDLEGLRGIQLQAYSLAQLTGKYSGPDYDIGKAEDAYYRSLKYLETLVSEIARDGGTRYTRVLEGPFESTPAAVWQYNFQKLVDAVPPSAFRATLPQYLGPYAAFLNNFEEPTSAVLAAQLSVDITREVLQADPSLSIEPLGRRLIELRYCIAERHDIRPSLKVAGEALDIFRRLSEEDPDRYREQYLHQLDGHAGDLALLNDDVDTEEIYQIRREVLKMARESYTEDPDPDYQAPLLLEYLSICGNVAKNLGHIQDALMLSFEAVALARENFARLVDTKEEWRAHLIAQTAINAERQEAAGHSHSARAMARTLLDHVDHVSAKRLARSYRDAAKLLAKSDDVRDMHAAALLEQKLSEDSREREKL